jgi:hypothetical protein
LKVRHSKLEVTDAIRTRRPAGDVTQLITLLLLAVLVSVLLWAWLLLGVL